MTYGKMTEKMRRHIWTTATCPYCGSHLLEGPQGGLMTNVLCSNKDECGARFNMAPINLPGGFDEVTRVGKGFEIGDEPQVGH